MIERVIDSAMEAGADDFYVVVGYKSACTRAHLEKVSRSKGAPITIIENEGMGTSKWHFSFKSPALFERTLSAYDG